MSRDLPPSRTAPQFVVRLPSEEFRQEINSAATEQGRSMNAEIVARLQQSLEDAEKISRLEKVIAEQSELISTQRKIMRTLGFYVEQFAFSNPEATDEQKQFVSLIKDFGKTAQSGDEDAMNQVTIDILKFSVSTGKLSKKAQIQVELALEDASDVIKSKK